MLLHSTENAAQCSTISQTELWVSTMNSSNQHRTLDSLTPMTIANTGEKPAAGAQAASSHCFFPTPAAYRTGFFSGMNPSQEDAPLAMVNTALPKRRCCWTHPIWPAVSLRPHFESWFDSFAPPFACKASSSTRTGWRQTYSAWGLQTTTSKHLSALGYKPCKMKVQSLHP